MRTLLAFLLVATVCVLASAPAHAGVITGPVVNPANGHSYYLLTANTWTASEAEAISLGGHLVTINDAAENAWVFSTFAAPAGGPTRNVWFGLTDQAVEGSFVWASGEPVTYTNWAPGEPNNTFGSEDYGHFYTNVYGLLWNDATNTGTNISFGPIHGVVEVAPAATVPEPSMLVLAGFAGVGVAVGVLRRRQSNVAVG